MTGVSVMRAGKATEATAADFHARVDELLPLIEKRAEEAESLGHMTDDVVAALRQSGIYTMLFPKVVGGAELAPFDALQIVERLSYAHASAGWCTVVNNMEGMTMAIYIEDAGIAPGDIDEIYVGTFNGGFVRQDFPSSLVLQHLPELRYRPITRYENACASGSAAIHGARDFLLSGRGRFALVIGVEKMTATPPCLR